MIIYTTVQIESRSNGFTYDQDTWNVIILDLESRKTVSYLLLK